MNQTDKEAQKSYEIGYNQAIEDFKKMILNYESDKELASYNGELTNYVKIGINFAREHFIIKLNRLELQKV